MTFTVVLDFLLVSLLKCNIILTYYVIYIISITQKITKKGVKSARISCNGVLYCYTLTTTAQSKHQFYNWLLSMKKTISQLQYEFAQECKNKKYHFKKSEEQSAFDRYQRDLSGVSLRAEKKYQSWLRTAQLKHNTSLSLIDSQPVIKVEKKKKDPTLPPKLQAYEKISDSVASILCRVKKMDGS